MKDLTAKLLVFALLLTACARGQPQAPTTAPTRVAPSLPSTPTPISRREPKWTPTPPMTPRPTPTHIVQADGPPGLIFRVIDSGDDALGELAARGSLWQITANGTAARLAACAGPALSPDGGQALYQLEADIWVIDLATCESRNLTQTPDAWEGHPQWWPARPEVVLFGVDPEMDWGTPGAVGIDGQGYRRLIETGGSYGLAAPSPDGRTIAFDVFSGATWLYRWDSGLLALDPADYGLDVQRMSSPSWSPDGAQLAWVVGIGAGQEWRIDLAVFDLRTHSGRLLHPYLPVGREGWPPAAVWSPDGRWLAFNAWSDDPSASGIWVAATDGSYEVQLDPGLADSADGPISQSRPPLWSPDGRWLVFSLGLDGSPEHWFVETGEWLPRPIRLPVNSLVVDFRNP